MKQNKIVLRILYKNHIKQIKEGKEKTNMIGKKPKRIGNVNMDEVEILYCGS